MRSKNSSLKVIRIVCMFGLPILLLIAWFLNFEVIKLFQQKPLIVNWFYTIALTANIGYFTNYIAIKMLFKPHFKTAFGRQGLIPKNQEQLADSLSNTLANNFLSSKQWSEYLTDSNLINTVLTDIKISSNEWLKEPKNINKINQWLIEYCRNNEDSINLYISSIQQDLINKFSSQLDAQELLTKGFAALEKQFSENPENMQQIIDPIIKKLAENIPEISHSLAQSLDEHIEDQDTIKRSIAKMARWSTDFSSEDIKHYLFRMVASFEFRETLFNGLKSLVKEYQNKPLLIDGNELKISEMISEFVNGHLNAINWVDLVVNQLDKTSKIKLEKILMAIHQQAFIAVETKLNDSEIKPWLINKTVNMVSQLDLRKMIKSKAVAFSPQKMESIFQSMISEQLVFIELLGAILGALSGLALINIKVFFVLSSLAASFYILDNLITSKMNDKKKDNEIRD